MVAECGCPYDPEYDEGSLGWHLIENHPEICPNGARRFYEGDDPEGFRMEMWKEFGFEVLADDPEFQPGGWTEERGWSFTIPAGLVHAIVGSERWLIGS